jgi:NAD(P)H-flavin reductase
MSRPDVRQIVLDKAGKTKKGSVMVCVCGPKPLVDSTVDAANEACDPQRVAREDYGGDVVVEAELFD